MNSDPAPSIADRLSRWRSRFSISRTKSKPAHLRRGALRRKTGRAVFCAGTVTRFSIAIFADAAAAKSISSVAIGDTLVFVEVKTRTGEDFGRPFETHSRRASANGSRVAVWPGCVCSTIPDILFRFDVVEVVLAESEKPSFELIRSAFKLPDRYIY